MGCIHTIDKLRRRSKILVNVCYLCKGVDENCNHLLLWCLVAYRIWTMVYSILGISWGFAGSVRDEFWLERGWHVRGSKRKISCL